MASRQEDDARLQDLAALRLCRPAFARMVSWEFGREDYNKPASRKPGNKSRITGCHGSTGNGSCKTEAEGLATGVSGFDDVTAADDIDDNDDAGDDDSYSSDSSMYFSAEEYTYDDNNELDDKTEYPSENAVEMDSKSSCSSTSVPIREQERKRRPSKKQRKKRVRNFKMHYLSLAVPFQNVESLGVELPYDSVHDSVVSLSKEVPSLVELCMRCKGNKMYENQVRGDNPERTALQVPYGLYHMTSKYRHDGAMAALQLSWLHRTLSLHNKLLSGSDKEHFVLSETSGNKELKFVCRPLRNMWALYECKVDRSRLSQQSAAKLINSLPVTITLLPTHGIECEKGSKHLMWSHLAHCIDLMLPATLPSHSGGKRQGQTTEEWVDKATMTCIVRVKRALALRYPCLIEVLFEAALPYALWARGQVKRAAELFLHLSEQQTGQVKKAAELFLHLSEQQTACNPGYRATHLNEAGRLYAQFGELAMARKMYLRAAELCCPGTSDDVRQALIGQAMMLVANQEDTGVFSPEKARGAARAWDAVLNMYSIPEFAEDAAFLSLFCYHAGQYEGISWLNEAQTRLQVWVERAPHLYLYLSMIHALKGDSQLSEATFKQFARKTRLHDLDFLPGQPAHPQRNYTPWKPMVDMVKKHGQLPVIKLQWRTQLCHPIFNHESKGGLFVTDISCSDLSLHLDADGNLTGNLQMLLPPMRTIRLDPFTGSLAFPSVPLHSEVWRPGVSADQSEHSTDYLLLPQQREVFRDSCGRTVYLLLTSKLRYDKREWSSDGTQTAVLTWHCPLSGQWVKLDLRKTLRQHIKQKIADTIRKEETDITEMSQQLEALELFHSSGWAVTSRAIRQYVSHQWQMVNEMAKLERKGFTKRAKKTGDRCRKKIYSESASGNVFRLKVSHHTQVGQMLVLQMSSMTVNTNNKDNICVLINCETAESFLNPTIVCEPDTDPFGNVFHISLRIPSADSIHHGCKGEIIGVTRELIMKPLGRRETEDQRRIYFYNTKAELLCEIEAEGFIAPGTVVAVTEKAVLDTKLVLGPRLYSVHPNCTRLVCNDLNQSTLSPIHYPLIQGLQIIGDHLLVTTQSGVSLARHTTLQPLHIHIKTRGPCPLTLGTSEKYMCIKGEFGAVNVLKEKTILENTGSRMTRAAVGIGNYIVLMELNKSDSVDVTLALELPGRPKEVHFMGQQVGFLVTAGVHSSNFAYCENLYHVDYDGNVRGILPCLGLGPRSFFSFPHQGRAVTSPGGEMNSDQTHPLAGWYVYMRDGHGGLRPLRSHGRESEQEVLEKLQQDGVLRSQTLNIKDNGSVVFFVSLDGNPYPSGKPRLLEPIELKQERQKIKADLEKRMANASQLRKDTFRRVKRKARITSARQRQAMANKEKAEEALQRIYKERLEMKQERAARNRQQSRHGHRK
ncbi:uncharacterized protein LOC135479766 [Liolophura sinensis]|uniref:uncharacterized protein LOC135479766 n=1 Tax=Liolophura sinensis TaxID=3198878 RepID=UPI0031581001